MFDFADKNEYPMRFHFFEFPHTLELHEVVVVD